VNQLPSLLVRSSRSASPRQISSSGSKTPDGFSLEAGKGERGLFMGFSTVGLSLFRSRVIH